MMAEDSRRIRLVQPATASVDRVEAVYREHGDRLWRAVRAFAGDADVASDAVAEAFAQLIRRGDEVRDPAAWVWRTAFRIAAGELKVSRDRATVQLTGDTPAVTAPADGAALDLLRALSQLSRLQRAALLLHDYAGFPAREAAAIVGSSEPAMRVHLMRGRRKMRALLGE